MSFMKSVRSGTGSSWFGRRLSASFFCRLVNPLLSLLNLLSMAATALSTKAGFVLEELLAENTREVLLCMLKRTLIISQWIKEKFGRLNWGWCLFLFVLFSLMGWRHEGL